MHPFFGVGTVVAVLLAATALTNYYRLDERASPPLQIGQASNNATIGVPLQEKTDRGELRAERDLIAQEGMARWAFWLLWATVAGILLLAATLRETWKAGQSAAQILLQTRRQADIAEDSAKRQLRAYMNIANVVIEDVEAGNPFRVTVHINNVGQTPAKDWQSWAQVFFRQNPDTDKLHFGPLGRRSRLDIGAGLSFRIDLPLTNIPSQIGFEGIANGKFSIMVAGLYSYRDVFDILHRGTFRYYLNFVTLKKGKAAMTSCNRHNRSN